VINLGNIRPLYVKNIAIDLTKKYPDQFKHDDFQHNKMKVEELTDVGSKLLRNWIAGYVTRYLAAQKNMKDQPISE
jgi:small subunit ribosomal protein S17e